MTDSGRMNLRGLNVVSFESRRAKEMAELIRRYRGEPFVAPSMREVPLGENRTAIESFKEIEAGKFDVLILMTGVGARTLYQAWLTEYPRERVLAALRKARLVARGSKPVAALKELGVVPAITVPEPNTWRELLAVLDGAAAVSGKCIAVQEYGIPNPELVAGLRQRGATVKTIAVYRWALPEDLAPLRRALEMIVHGGADVALFTNGAQADHLFKVAAEEKIDQQLRLACARLVVGSVGPICTRILQGLGLHPDIEPEHPKMGSLLAEVAACASDLLRSKRARSE